MVLSESGGAGRCMTGVAKDLAVKSFPLASRIAAPLLGADAAGNTHSMRRFWHWGHGIEPEHFDRRGLGDRNSKKPNCSRQLQ